MQEPLLIGLMIWHILAVSDNHKHFQTAIDEYLKRSEKNIDLHLLKPSRKDDPISVRREETMALIKILEKKPKPIILLSIDGKQLISEDIATYLETNQQQATFLIGGPYGVDESLLLPYLDEKISFGKQTMPHGLALLVLLEQLRRTQCILQGKKYHY